jgi:O-antigen ligase
MDASTTPRHRDIATALFALGLSLPLFAGGNTLMALDPVEGMYVFDVVAIAVAWVLLRRDSERTRWPTSVRSALACLLVLGCWWLAALLWRPSGPRAFLDAQGMLCAILLFVACAHRPLCGEQIDTFVRGLLLGALGTVAFSQYQYWIAFPRTAPLVNAAGLPVSLLVNANFYNANCYAAFLGAVCLLVATLAIANGDTLARVAIPIFVMTILLSQSRSVAVLLVLCAIALYAIRRSRAKVGAGRLVVEALWVAVPAAAGSTLAMIDVGELWRVGTLGRVAIWRASVAIACDHWALGVGLGGFGDYFPRYRLDDYYTRYPHNFVLEIAAELGVVGLVAILGFLMAALAQPLSRFAAARRSGAVPSLRWAVIMVASAMLLVHGLVDIDWHAPANPILFFILFGMVQHLAISPPSDRSAR